MNARTKTALAASCLALACAAPAAAEMATGVVELTKAREARGVWGKECAIKALHPTEAANPLAKIINEYINEELGGSYMGDLFDARAMVAHYIDVCLKPGEDDRDMTADMPPGEERTEIGRLAETDGYVTYEVTSHSFAGGAHGVNGYDGMTFRKSDGRRMGWDAFVNTAHEGFRNLVKKGLKAFWEIETDEELAENLLLEDDGGEGIPLPQAAPLFTKEGVKLTYQPYEIASYAMGMPSFVVPYAEIAPYLSRAAREMLKL